MLDRLSNDISASRFIKSVASDANGSTSPPMRNHKLVPDSAKMLLVLSELLVKHLASSDEIDADEYIVLKKSAFSIQKHLFYWAAHPVEIQRPAPHPKCSALQFAYTRVFSQSQSSVGGQCLIYYCQLVLTHSITLITKQPMPAPLFGKGVNIHM